MASGGDEVDIRATVQELRGGGALPVIICDYVQKRKVFKNGLAGVDKTRPTLHGRPV